MNNWHVITVGHLSRNKFWGESETDFCHPVLSTSTVIQTQHGNILVDPSLDGAAMADTVYNSCGIKPEDIHMIYSTHYHNDHWMGVSAFPKAKLYMAEQDLEDLLSWKEYFDAETIPVLERFVPVTGELVPGVKLISLPGHTYGLQGVYFEAPEGRILITGDAVMNYEFFQAGEGYFFGASSEMAAESIKKAASMADYIVPGHGNYFSVKAYSFNMGKTGLGQEEYSGSVVREGIITEYTKIGEIIKKKENVELICSYAPNMLTPIGIYMARDIPLKAMITTSGISTKKAGELIDRLNARK